MAKPWHLLCLCLVAPACLPKANPNNPFDPASPIAAQAKATLSGTIRGLAVDANAVATLLTGATVSLDGPDATTPRVTGDDGAFAFSDLTPGVYELTVTHPTHFPNVSTFALTPGVAPATTIDLYVLDASSGSTNAHLTGIVLRSGQQSLPSSEQNHAGISVELVGSGVRTFTSTSGAFDMFVAPDVYTLTLSASNYATATIPSIVASAGAEVAVASEPIVLVANPGGLAGSVQLEGLVAGGLGGATLSLFGAGTTRTSADGSFAFNGLATGVYALTASMPGYASQTISGLSVRGGLQAQAPPIALAIARGTLSGVVQLPASANAGNVKVTLQSSFFNAVASTNIDGSFTLAGVPVGTYTVLAQAVNYLTYTSSPQTVLANTTTAVPTVVMSPATPALSLNSGALYTRSASVSVVSAVQGATQMRLSQDPTFANAALGDTVFSAFAATSAFTLRGGDGAKIVYAQFLDAFGSQSSKQSSITLDTAAPVAAAPTRLPVQINLGAPYTRVPGGVVTLSFAVTDALSGVASMQIDSKNPLTTTYQPFATQIQVTLDTPGSDGNKTLYVNFKDYAGNSLSAPLSATITLDTTAPSVVSLAATCNGVTPASQCNGSLVTLSVGAPDAVLMALSNDVTFSSITWLPYTPTAPFLLPPGDGVHTVAVMVQDAAGNVSMPATLALTVDTQPPTSPALALNGGALYTNNQNVPLVVSAFGAAQANISNCVSFAATGCNTSGWLDLALAPAVWPLAGPDGLNVVYAEFRDVAGNLSPVATGAITLKRTPPTLASPAVQVVTDTAGFTSSISALVSLNAAGATSMQVGCSGTLVGAPWTAYAPTVTCLLPAGDGQKSIAVAFADNANNQITAPLTTFYYDGTVPSPPTISRAATVVSTPTYSLALAGSAVDAAITQDPNPTGAHFIYQLKGGQYVDWTDCGTSLPAATPGTQDGACSGPPFTFTLTPNVANNLSVRARDRANNTSSPALVAVTHDSIAPPTPIAANGSPAWGSFGDVDAGDGYVVVNWAPPTPSTDVAGYLVYYGSATSTQPGDYHGGFAAEGASPINVGLPCSSVAGTVNCSFRLSGLPNGATTVVDIASYDRTQVPSANLSALASSGYSITPAEQVLTADGKVGLAALSPGGAALASAVAVRRGLVYVVSAPAGTLSVVDAAVPSKPTVLGATAASFTSATGIYLHGRYAYVCDGTRLVTVDVGNPTAPVIVDTNTAAACAGIAGQGNFIYTSSQFPAVLNTYTLGGGACGNTSALNKPCLVAQNNNSVATEQATALAAQGNYVYMLTQGGAKNVVVYDVSNSSSAQAVGGLQVGQGALKTLALSGMYVYVSGGSGAYALNVSTPQAVRLAATLSLSNSATASTIYGGKWYGLNSTGIDTVDVDATNTSMALRLVTSLAMPLTGRTAIAAEDNYAYLAGGAQGLVVLHATGVRSIEAGATLSNSGNSSRALVAVGNTLMWGYVSLSVLHANPHNLTEFANPTLPTNCVPVGTVVTEGDLVVATDNGYQEVLCGGRLTESGSIMLPYPSYVSEPYSGWTLYSPLMRWPYVYTLDYNSTTGVGQALGVTDVRSFTSIARLLLSTGSGPQAPAMIGNYLYTTLDSNLLVIDVNNPLAPALVSTIPLLNTVAGLHAMGTRLYGDTGSGFRVLSVASPGTLLHPVDIGGYQDGDGSIGGGISAVSGQFLYYDRNDLPSIRIFDVTNPNAPLVRGTYANDGGTNPIPFSNQVITNNTFQLQTLWLR